MPNFSYYRNEAERCRRLAAETQNISMGDHWRKLAREYDALADDMVARPRIQFAAMQQQPVQQQSKMESDENE